MNIEVGGYLSPNQKSIEVVERKGIGHPDTVADQLAEAVSIDFTKYCLGEFGIPLAHNVDKTGVMGGKPFIDYGVGYLVNPIRVLLNGRITRDFAGKQIPVWDIAHNAVSHQLNKALPSLNVEKDVRFIDESTDHSKFPYKFHPRDKDDIPELKKAYANDTVVVVAAYPNTPSENATLALEGYFYDESGKPKFTDVGQDIKVMLRRVNQDYRITLCVPFFSQQIKNESMYWERRDAIEKDLQKYAKTILPDAKSIDLTVNTQDPYWGQRLESKPARSFYFVATGGALDFGEEGFVGRGNTRSGFIPSTRAYTMEAPYGKNPVYHAGKVLAVVADTIAQDVGKAFDCESEVWIMPNNGDPLLEPSSIVVNTSKLIDHKSVQPYVEDVLSRNNWTDLIVNQQLFMPTPGGRK